MTATAELLQVSTDAPLLLLVQLSIDSHAERHRLSPKQHRLANRLVDGKPFKVIADELGISRSTLRSHAEELYRRMGVGSRGELVAKILGRA